MDSKLQQFLSELKNYGIKNNIPNISNSTGQMLHFLIRLKKYKKILEIGTANGYSTIFLADAVSIYGGQVDTYELSEPASQKACKNFKQAGVDHLINAYCADVLKSLSASEQKYDFIFIDGQKANYHLFWELAKTLISAEGLIVVDDVVKFKDKVQPFMDLIENDSRYEKCLIPVDGDDGVLLIMSTEDGPSFI